MESGEKGVRTFGSVLPLKDRLRMCRWCREEEVWKEEWKVVRAGGARIRVGTSLVQGSDVRASGAGRASSMLRSE